MASITAKQKRDMEIETYACVGKIYDLNNWSKYTTEKAFADAVLENYFKIVEEQEGGVDSMIAFAILILDRYASRCRELGIDIN